MFNFYLGEAIPNLTDWIQAICAVLLLLLTTLMAWYAKNQLSTWQKAKMHETVEEGYVNAYNAMYMVFEFLRIRGDINLLNDKQQKLYKELSDQYPELNRISITIATRDHMFNERHKEDIRACYGIATRVIHTLRNDTENPLYVFYSDFIFHYTKTRLDIDQLLRYRHSQYVVDNNINEGRVYYMGFTPDRPYFEKLTEFYTDEQIHKYGNDICEALDEINKEIQISFHVSSSNTES